MQWSKLIREMPLGFSLKEMVGMKKETQLISDFLILIMLIKL